MEHQMIREVQEVFAWAFPKADSPRVFFAPGRVNLIGEHIDYNGGHVLPCALTLGTWTAAAPRKDRLLRVYSPLFPEDGLVTCSLDDLHNDPTHGWANYVKAVAWAFLQQRHPIPRGLDMVFVGDLPAKAGLSSSASVEVVTATALNEIFGLGISKKEMALLCQMAENRFIGVSCGIMDQFASVFGQRDHALFLNTATLDYQAVPLDLAGKRLIIVNSNVKHELATSAYNERRSQCQQALADINKVRTTTALCELTPEELEALQGVIQDPLARKRARHAVMEEARTRAAMKALGAGDIIAFGRLMSASHESLKTDFEVSCPELDLLAETAQSLPGVLGARMTGGGFGGCTVNLVEEEAVDQFTATLGRIYKEGTGRTASFYRAKAGDGAGEC